MLLIENLLDIKNDYVFKRLFGHVGNEDITKDLLKSITNEKITEIELDCNPITEKDIFDDKVGILDIKAKLNGNINCDIEMQVVDRKNVEKRILFYWSKMYSGSIKQGIDYSELKKGIVVLIVDYNLEKLKNISKFMTKWNIREEDSPKIILTEDLEFYIIELEKVKKMKEDNILKSWLEFIKNPKVVSSMENNEIKKAREELMKISKDEHERYLAELRQKYIMDQKAIQDFGYDKGIKKGLEQGLEQGLAQGLEQGLTQGIEQGLTQGLEQGLTQGIEQGLAQGIEQGLAEGKKQEKIEIAQYMKAEKMDSTLIEKITGLSKEEIESL